MKTANYPRFRYTAAYLATFQRSIPDMPEQAADRKRCATCDRWSGPRSVGHISNTAASVDIDSETVSGLCQGGPWDGNERRARSACGHWIIWQALVPPTSTTET